MRATTIALVAGLALASPAFAQRGRAKKPSDMSEKVRELAQGHLQELEKSGDFGAAQQALGDLLDRAIRYSTDKELDAIVQAYAPLLVVAQLAQADREIQGELFPVLLEHEELAWTLAMSVDPEHDQIPGVYKTLAALIDAHGAKKVAVFDNLAAAICVVHDAPYARRINENTAQAMAPEDIFAYYADHVRELVNDPRHMPPDLLVYVVDTTETSEQMAWALSQYNRDVNLGNRFFEIEYDDDHFRKGTPKKLTQSGDEFSLQAIKQHGGVCADQAYFAMSVGKAKGIPSAYVVARGAEVGHAWLGYLETRGRQASWNFDAGRYDAYQNIRGNIYDPQTRQPRSDAEVGLLAEDATKDEAQLRLAETVCAAAARLGSQRAAKGFEAPDAPPDGVTVSAKFKPRTHSVEDQLGLLEAGLRLSPAHMDGWQVLIDIAERQELDVKQMDSWARVIDRLCGKRYPDSMVEVLSPMFRSVPDAEDQTRLWSWLFDRLRRRPDLASEVLMNQGDLMRRAGEPGAAWAAYMEVVNRFANHGTSVVGALAAAEVMVRDEKGDTIDTIRRDIIPMYERAWRAIDRPQQMGGAFRSQSNWYRVGYRLMELWGDIGEDSRAQGIDAVLNSRKDKAFDD